MFGTNLLSETGRHALAAWTETKGKQTPLKGPFTRLEGLSAGESLLMLSLELRGKKINWTVGRRDFD